MMEKDISIKNYFTNSPQYKKNIITVKKIFKSLLRDIKEKKIPQIDSYKKDYKLDFSKKIIKKFSKYNSIIIIGMGGSILGARSIYSFLKKKIKKKVFFFDNLDEDLHFIYKNIKNKKNACYIIISKSGNTLETISNFSLILSKKLLNNKLIIITKNSNNALIEMAKKQKAEVIFHKDIISGRYSVLSEVGMFPAKLMGLNINDFKNLKTLIKNKKFIYSLIESVAAIFTLHSKKINNSVIFNYDTSLNNLGLWYQQLVSESLGKNGKGIYTTLAIGPRDQHSLLQLYVGGPKDKFFTFFNSSEKNNFKLFKKNLPSKYKFLEKKYINDIINTQCEAVKNIFRLKKIPFREITFNKKKESQLGAIFTFFVLETILLSRLMKVNPFNQPGVEEVKTKTKQMLS